MLTVCLNLLGYSQRMAVVENITHYIVSDFFLRQQSLQTFGTLLKQEAIFDQLEFFLLEKIDSNN